jgi:hypothetical protein
VFREPAGIEMTSRNCECVLRIVTGSCELDVPLGLVIKRVHSELTPGRELYMTVGFHCDNYWRLR